MGTEVVSVSRRTNAILIAAAFLLARSLTALATDLYWVPAPQLAPQGSGGSIASCDLDADGDWDVSRVQACKHFWNVGTPQLPVWQLVSGVVPGLTGCSYRNGTYGDLDADGDFDMIIGCFEPHLRMFWNVGSPHVPQWQEDPAALEGMGGYYSAPFLGDLDDDGDLDLIVATTSAIVGLYENTGTPQVPEWTWQGWISGVYLGASCPRAVLGDLDGDGDLDMIGITASTPAKCWENIGTPQGFQFVENPSMLIGVVEPLKGDGVSLLDVDGDGDLDLLIAADTTQLFLYLNERATGVEPRTWGTIKAMYR